MYWLPKWCNLSERWVISFHTTHMNSWDTWIENSIDKAAGWFSGIELIVPLGWKAEFRLWLVHGHIHLCVRTLGCFCFGSVRSTVRVKLSQFHIAYMLSSGKKIFLAPNSLNDEAYMQFWCLMIHFWHFRGWRLIIVIWWVGSKYVLDRTKIKYWFVLSKGCMLSSILGMKIECLIGL